MQFPHKIASQASLNINMTTTLDVEEAPAFILELIQADRFVEAQWVVGLTPDGEEYGKFVTEDTCGFWGDEFRFGDLEDNMEVEDKSTSHTWIVSNLPKDGVVRIIFV
jgi:hypothetical protein